MSKLLCENDATGKAKEVYDDIKANLGMVPNLFKAQAAVCPEWLEINWKRVKCIFLKQRVLDRKTKELIAITVSLLNDCDYCLATHESMAIESGITEKEINETKVVIELLTSLNHIAKSLKVPCDCNG